MTVLEQLKATYKARKEEESLAKIVMESAKLLFNDALADYNTKEAAWYAMPNEWKQSEICYVNNVEYFGSPMMTAGACEYVRIQMAGGGYQGINPAGTWGLFVQSEFYLMIRDIILDYRAALGVKNAREGEYDASLEAFNNARILSGKALGSLQKWKFDQLSPEEQAEINDANRPVTTNLIQEFSWTIIGIGFGVLGGLYILYRILKR